MTRKETRGIGFSYLRFSDPSQAKGDSKRRQGDGRAAAWCKKNNVTLDTSLSLRDEGVSAFRGKHRSDKHDLGKFLDAAKRGRIPRDRDVYFIVENLDRLSREEIRPALRLFLEMQEYGINLVSLAPEKMFRHDSTDPFELMQVIMELARGHGESARKSFLNGAKWQEKLARAKEGRPQPPRKKDDRVTDSITDRLPAWVEDRGGKLCLIADRAAVVKRIFQLAANGHGVSLIVKRLTADGVPPFGNREWVEEKDEDGNDTSHWRAVGGHYGSGVWTRAYVQKLLKDRRAVGEYRPCGTGRKPTGEVFPGYFPAAVSEDEFNAARAGAAERKKRGGRVGKHVNLFSGLLHNARGGDKFFETALAQSKGGKRILVSNAGAEGRAQYESFPADVFERAVLSCLAEIDPREILNGDGGPDKTAALAGELMQLEASIAAIIADLDANGESPTQHARLRQKEARKAEVVRLLAEARQKAATPLSEAWGECQSLVSAAAGEENRLRLRAALRRICPEIWVLVVRTQGRRKLAAVRLLFGEDRQRTYAIETGPEGWRVRSDLVTPPDFTPIDLRHPEHVWLAENLLRGADLDEFFEECPWHPL